VVPCNNYQFIKTDLSFNPEDEGTMLLRNVGNDLQDNMLSHSPYHCKNLRPRDVRGHRLRSSVPHVSTTLPTLGLHFYSEMEATCISETSVSISSQKTVSLFLKQKVSFALAISQLTPRSLGQWNYISTAVDADEWSVSRQGRFFPGKTPLLGGSQVPTG
jgi:hypothetical protein